VWQSTVDWLLAVLRRLANPDHSIHTSIPTGYSHLYSHRRCLDGKKGKKVWYDNATTLTPKFQLAGKNKLRGVGVWKVDNLPQGKDGKDPHAAERKAMWEAVKGWQAAGAVEVA